MLLRNQEQQNFLLSEVKKIAKDINARLIFGAMMGSTSRGTQRADSNYDVRFLYLRGDFPEKNCIPFQMGEDELVKRSWLEDKTFGCVPLWEATSFLHFLLEPRFTDEISDGLYVAVELTFRSPYTWDPYGLQGKLVPLLNKIFRGEYAISYYAKELERYRAGLYQGAGVVKKYLRAVHAAAAIEWCVKYSEFPPVDLETLLRGLGRIAVWEETKKILYQARKDVRQVWEKGLSKQDLVKTISPTILTPNNPILLEYIDMVACHTSLRDAENENDIIDATEIVNSMYEIIYRAVFESDE